MKDSKAFRRKNCGKALARLLWTQVPDTRNSCFDLTDRRATEVRQRDGDAIIYRGARTKS
jgi:hypothetical protein